MKILQNIRTKRIRQIVWIICSFSLCLKSFLLGLSIAGLNPTFLVTWAGAVAIVRGAGLISELHWAPAFAVGGEWR